LAALLPALAAAAAAAAPAVAQEVVCPRLAPRETRVEVRVEPEPAPRVSAVPRAVIRRHAAGPGRVTTGLTTTRIEARAGYGVARAGWPGGAACVALETIKGELANRDVEILVDGKYGEASCERAAVLDHEREHVRINAVALREGEPMLRRLLSSAARPWAGRWVPERQQQAIDAAIGRAVETAVARIRAAAAVQHAKLDSPESYARTQRRCENW
jgi:hypothetical protein